MAQVAAEVDIANLAGGLLKNKPVVSISPPDEDSKLAKAAAKWYDTIRRAALAEHPWNFALKRASIAAESQAPEFEYLYKYEQPRDYIRLVKAGETWYSELDYEDEDGFILINETGPLRLKYVFDQKDVKKFSGLFVLFFAQLLAAAMSYEVTGNSALGEALNKEAAITLQKAKSVDGQNRPPRRIQRTRTLEARRSRGRFRDWQRWGPN